jgi:uncharacterized RDD family membrane protein YckC
LTKERAVSILRGIFFALGAWLVAAPAGAKETAPSAPAASSASTVPSVSAPPRERDLLAQGSENRFWIAHVVKSADGDYPETDLVVRSQWSGASDWTPMPSIADRVVSIATSNDELLAVLANGQWEIADENDIRTGPTPLQISALLAIANEADTVWAVVRGVPWAAASGPSTKSAQTSPAEPPAVSMRLMVCRFIDGSWSDAHVLPGEVSDNPAEMSLAVVGQRPMLAWRASDERIWVSALTGRNDWTRPVMANAPVDAADFKLLTIHDRAVLWFADAPAASATTRPKTGAGGAGEVLVGDDFARRIPLAMPTTLPSRISCQTLVAALGNLRWIAYGGDKLIEQDYSLEEFPSSFPPAKMSVVGRPAPPAIPLTPWIAGDAILIAAAAGVARRQRSLTRAEQRRAPVDQYEKEKPHLAPMGGRFLAGLVDLAPILAVVAIVHPANSGNPLASIDKNSLNNLFILAAATYALHTLVAEVICGQSLGKMAFGLYVTDVQGKPARTGMIVVRNLLRLMDVFLVLPLLLVLISPLHQRVGDLAAGTVVISRDGDGGEEQ